MRTVTSLAAAAACLFATACSCTLIGCGPTFTVELTATPTGPFHVEAVAVGSGDRREFDCPDVTHCVAAAWFLDFTPEEVVVRVTTDAGTVEQTFRPAYDAFRPNGPGCGPVCRRAVVRVPLPA